MQMHLIEVKNLFKKYSLGKASIEVLKGINLIINKGEFLAIAGPSGSGKTTLLNILGCIDKPSSGEVFIDGQQTARMTLNELADVGLSGFEGARGLMVSPNLKRILIVELKERGNVLERFDDVIFRCRCGFCAHLQRILAVGGPLCQRKLDLRLGCTHLR